MGNFVKNPQELPRSCIFISCHTIWAQYPKLPLKLLILRSTKPLFRPSRSFSYSSPPPRTRNVGTKSTKNLGLIAWFFYLTVKQVGKNRSHFHSFRSKKGKQLIAHKWTFKISIEIQHNYFNKIDDKCHFLSLTCVFWLVYKVSDKKTVLVINYVIFWIDLLNFYFNKSLILITIHWQLIK